MIKPFLSEKDIAALALVLDNHAMTVIASMNCGDYLLLSADSEAGEAGDLKMTVNKLRQLPDLPLVWGTCGDDDAGIEFSEWLERRSYHTISNWEAFREEAWKQLATINNRRVKMMELAGVPYSQINRDNTCAAVLMAGYIGDNLEILDLSNNGQANFVRRDRLWAIGGIGPITRTIYYALRENSRLDGNAFVYDISNMQKIMKMTVGIAKLAGDPVHILKISATGIESIQ